MTHLNDDQIRAYTDQELPPAAALQAAAHLQGCPGCRARLERVQQAAAQVRGRLETLSPTPREGPRPAAEAYARLAQRSPIQSNQKARELPMLKRRSFLTALAVLTVLALIFTMTPARAWAGTFLNLFRVQRVQVITFDPSVVEGLHDQMNANSALFEQVFQEDLEITERGDARAVSSLDEAAQIAGFQPRVPAYFQNATIMVEPGMEGVLTIDQPKMQELLDLAGVDYAMPAELDGQVVKVDVSDVVVISTGCVTPDTEVDPDAAMSGCQTLAQMRSPEVNAPEALDVPRMGEAVFGLLGYAPDEARALSQRIDWTSTLVLPIPTDEGLTSRDVQVDGVTGTMLSGEGSAMLIWVKDGFVYAVRAPGGAEEALAIARSLQ